MRSALLHVVADGWRVRLAGVYVHAIHATYQLDDIATSVEGILLGLFGEKTGPSNRQFVQIDMSDTNYHNCILRRIYITRARVSPNELLSRTSRK